MPSCHNVQPKQRHEEEAKIEMKKLHFAFKRPHVKTNDFEVFFVFAGQGLEKGIFHPLVFILHGCVLRNNSTAQLTFLVAFVEPLGPIIAHICA